MEQRNGWLDHALTSFEKPLVRYAHRLTGNVEQARDVVQDTFLRLCRQPATKVAQLDGHLKEWLFTVCRNRAIDYLRKEGRMDTLENPELATTDETPAHTLEAREQQDRVLESVQALPTRQREMVHLKFVEGLSYRQIAKITGDSVSNVGYILHTALRALRQRLARPATRSES